MKKKICIIEIYYHSEFLSTLIKLLPNSDVYLTQAVYDDLSDESKGAQFIIKGKKEYIGDFLKRIDTSKYDLCFVNTIRPSLIYFPKKNKYNLVCIKNWKDFKPKCKSILTLHNLNAWHYKHQYLPHLKLWKSLDFFITSKYCKRILSNYKIINVVYEPMKKTAKNYFGSTHKIINIPVTYAIESYEKKDKEDVWFTIPGTVTKSRRDYITIKNAFEKLFKEYDNIKLILLGKNKDKISITGAEKKLITFENKVPRGEYETYLKESDFILIPSVKSTHIVTIVDEQYGFTKAPTVPDAIKWRKPLIIPYYIPIDDKIKTSTKSYKSTEELYAIVKKIMDSKDMRSEMKDNAIKNTDCYSIKSLIEELTNSLDDGVKCKK